MYRRRRSPPPNRYGTTTAPPPSAEYAEPANARCHCGNPVLRNVFPQRSPSCRAFASAPQNGEPSPTADRKASSERPALHRRIRDLRPNAAPGRKKVGIALAGGHPMPPSVEAQGLPPRRQNRRRIPKANAGRETEDRSECRDAPVNHPAGTEPESQSPPRTEGNGQQTAQTAAPRVRNGNAQRHGNVRGPASENNPQSRRSGPPSGSPKPRRQRPQTRRSAFYASGAERACPSARRKRTRKRTETNLIGRFPAQNCI